MTEQEAIENLRKARYCYDCQCEMNDCVECDMTINMASTALKEIQQYRAIGTVEECREAVEKQRAKRPVFIENRFRHRGQRIGECTTLEPAYNCPHCNSTVWKLDAPRYCRDCGQKLDWSEEE